MPVGTALAVGSALGGGVSSRRSKRRGDDAQDEADAALAEQMKYLGKTTDVLDALQPTIDKFAAAGQENFDNYQEMMGPLEDTLNDYYMGLDPDMYAAQGNQTAQGAYQNTMNQVNEQLASQGIMNSGVNTQMGMQYGNQMAQTKAQNIMDAPEQVAQQQQNWLGYTANRADQGWNQMQQGVNMQANQANQYNQAYTNMANAYGGQSAQANQAAQNNYNQGNQALGQAARGVGFGLMGDSQGWFA